MLIPAPFLRPLALLVCILFVAAAAPPPCPAFGIKEEREIGEKLLSLVTRQFKVLDEPDVAGYINELGKSIVKVSGTSFFDFHFFIIDNREFNAFAAPSGLIFVHSGLVASCASEDELVAVLAHEIAHVQSRHIAKQMEKSAKVNIGTLALIIAGIAVGAGPVGNALIAGSMAASASLALKFSREDEEEADRLAYNWMVKMGRDRSAMLTMLRRMRRIAALQSGDLPQYLLTHPDPGARMGYVIELLARDNGKVREKKQDDEFAFRRFRLRVMAMSQGMRAGAAAGATGDARWKAYGLAIDNMEQGDYRNAIKKLKRVAALFPGRTEPESDLGVVYFRAGRLKEAERELKKARKRAPDIYSSYYLARTLEEEGDFAAALDLFRRLQTQMDFSASFHLHMSRCLDASGSHGAARYHLALHHWYQGRGKAAIRELEKAVKMLPARSPLRQKAETRLKRIRYLEKKGG